MKDRAVLFTRIFNEAYWAHPEVLLVFVAALSIERCNMTEQEMKEFVWGENEVLEMRCPVLASALSYLVLDECLEGLPDWRKIGEVWPLPAYWLPRREGDDVPTTE